MKPTMRYLLLVPLSLAALSTFNSQLSTAFAQGTAFTYQGRLSVSGAPFTGSAEFQFRLFDTATGGAAIATSPHILATVSAGQFIASLDFGTAVFRGADRFLEIQVRTNVSTFITLTPRQALTPAPCALFAQTAGTVTNNSITAPHIASGQVVKSLNDLKGDVGLIAGANVTLTTNGNDLTVSAGPWMPVLTLGRPDIAFNGGRVGIGTATPNKSCLLDVRGDVMCENLFAPGGEENLRIVRGVIDPDGTIVSGEGFSCARLDTGIYTLTFSPQFSSPPTVVALPPSQIIEGEATVVFLAGPPPTVSQAELLVWSLADRNRSDRRVYFVAVGPP